LPFTVSHLAAVLPARLRWPSELGTALCVGAITPDVLYFVPGRPGAAMTHGLVGLFTLDLALGLTLFVAWRALLARPLHDLAPRWWRARVAPPGRLAWGALPVAALGVLLGAATHVVWDAFTHRWGAGVELVPALADPVFTVSGYTVWGYRLAQHLSTALGLAFIVWTLWRWARRTPPRVPVALRSPRRTWALLLAGAVLGGGVAVAIEWSPGAAIPLDDLRTFVWAFVSGTATGLAAAVAGYALWWHRATGS